MLSTLCCTFLQKNKHTVLPSSSGLDGMGEGSAPLLKPTISTERRATCFVIPITDLFFLFGGRKEATHIFLSGYGLHLHSKLWKPLLMETILTVQQAILHFLCWGGGIPMCMSPFLDGNLMPTSLTEESRLGKRWQPPKVNRNRSYATWHGGTHNAHTKNEQKLQD